MSRDPKDANIGLSSAAAAKWYSTNSGSLFEIKKTRLLKKAFETPGAYYEDRAVALEGAATQADDAFSSQYEKLIKEKVAPPQALQRANAYADSVHKALIADVDIEFPMALNQLAAKIGYSKGQAANSGFAVDPNTAMASKPRARRAKGFRMPKK